MVPFATLVEEITGERIRSEPDVFAAVASLGTDTVKNVSLYHIVPAAICFRDARQSDGAILATLLEGSTIEVDVNGRRWHGFPGGAKDLGSSFPWTKRPFHSRQPMV